MGCEVLYSIHDRFQSVDMVRFDRSCCFKCSDQMIQFFSKRVDDLGSWYETTTSNPLADEGHRTAWHIRVLGEFIFHGALRHHLDHIRVRHSPHS